MHQFYTPDIKDDIYLLNEEESKHCIRVLRLKTGDQIHLLDGKGKLFISEIINDHPKKCTVKIIEIQTPLHSKNWKLHIAIAPTKNMDRLEWFVEKATEIGIDSIIPVTCANSERVILKKERLVKVAIAAIKQSLNTFLPEIEDLSDFKKVIERYKKFNGQKFIAHCYSGDIKPHLKKVYKFKEDVLLLIGPEGDFTSEEVKIALTNDFKQVSLGENRLRTETAALYACTAINIINS